MSTLGPALLSWDRTSWWQSWCFESKIVSIFEYYISINYILCLLFFMFYISYFTMLQIFHNLDFHHGNNSSWWQSSRWPSRGYHSIVASITIFFTSNCESHAFWFLWSLNHVVGWKVRIDTGDWLYYVEFFASIVTAGICCTRE